MNLEVIMKTTVVGMVMFGLIGCAFPVFGACKDLSEEYQQEAMMGAISGLAQIGADMGAWNAGPKDYNTLQQMQMRSNKQNLDFAFKLQKKQRELDDCRREAERMESEDELWQDNMDSRYER